MKIYWIKTQASQRVLALVKHLDIDAELIELNLKARELKSEAFSKINPNQKVPVLVDGETIIWESSAIMAYLCIKVGSDMWPSHNPLEQVEVLRWLSWNDQHWGRATGVPYFEFVVKSYLKIGPPDKDLVAKENADLVRFAKVLDDHLKGKLFVACHRVTIADFQLASMACYWKESEMPFEQFPNIIRWLDHLNTLPGWANPWP
jgi:glutathione S-transferase